MKKTYKKIKSFAALFLLMATQAVAQPLNGLYTINAGLGTGGTNFQNFTAFAATINTAGVSGPVTVNVVLGSGPYVEQVTLNQITGVTGTNKLTINGNGNLLTFNSTNSAAPHTLLLNGTDQLTINDLQVEGQGATYALACILTAGADRNTFNRCWFKTPVNGTSSIQTPFSISSTATSPTGSGTNSGNYNTVNTCTISNGYYGCVFYGLTGAPFQTGNTIKDSWITDFYVYGFFGPYQNKLQALNNVIDRITRTASTTCYAFCSYYNTEALVEGNKVWKLFELMPGNTNQTMGYYTYYTPTPGVGRGTYRNNILTQIKCDGTIYGFYNYYSNSDYYNNTIDLDWAGATAANTIYGMYPYGTATYNNALTNNLITCRRGGAGSNRYGLYIAATGGISVVNNNIVMVGASGANNMGYYGGVFTTVASWNTALGAGTDFSVDPIYTSSVDLHPTNVAMNNLGLPMGLVYDQVKAVRNQATPDVGALEFLSPACAGAPSANSIAGPTWALCPGEDAGMILATLYPDQGLTYQWKSSTVSNVGPFNAIGTATNLAYTAPNMTTQTWFQVVMTCTNPGGGSISPVIQINIAGPTVSNIPYFENMETVGLVNRLPNCSWSASSQGVANCTSPFAQSGNRVPLSGTSMGYFNNASTGTSAFYTNPINMSTGITYSAALWYATEYFGYNNWTNLSILIGPNQSATNATVVASVGPAITGPYKLLSGLFTVPSAGTYYMGIRATSASGSAQYLSFDDLSITIPCQAGSVNSPNLTSSASSNTVCEGQNVGLNASGADTYTWTTGSNVPSTSDNPAYSSLGYTLYTVYGQNAITGCIAASTQTVYVNPAPVVFVVASPPVVCAGQPVALAAYGALTYAWSNASLGSNITVNPLANTSYTVIGTNAFGCSTSYGYNVTVNPLPTINAISSNPGEACKSDALTLTASGGLTYQWLSNTTPQVYQGNPITITSPATTIFTVTGTNANGCVGKFTLIQNINDCTGLSKISGTSGISIYPNPTAGEFTVQFNNNNDKTVEVTDVTGRVIVSSTSTDSNVNVNIKNLSNGIYYVKVKSSDSVEVVKIVKQ